ncbi:hypothetical protein AAEH85_22520, partial [Shewanella algae]|uniref:hypothetical protein n=1 Tax=Shewanella algae TaxID=38313 RepID=UPI00313AF20D
GDGVFAPVMDAVAAADSTVRSVPEQLTVYDTFSVSPDELLTCSFALRASGANAEFDWPLAKVPCVALKLYDATLPVP